MSNKLAGFDSSPPQLPTAVTWGLSCLREVVIESSAIAANDTVIIPDTGASRSGLMTILTPVACESDVFSEWNIINVNDQCYCQWKQRNTFYNIQLFLSSKRHLQINLSLHQVQINVTLILNLILIPIRWILRVDFERVFSRAEVLNRISLFFFYSCDSRKKSLPDWWIPRDSCDIGSSEI